MKKLHRILAGLAVSVAASMAHAVPTIGFDDGVGTQSGSISWGGGLSPLVGSNINLFSVDGTETVINIGPVNALTCVGCFLNFETGAYSTTFGSISQWLGGGAFNVTGSLYDGVTLLTSGNLLSGSFSGLPPSLALAGNSGLFVGAGTNILTEPLVDYFGEPLATYTFAATAISLGGCSDVGAGFNCEVTNADVDNIADVPIVGTAALMAVGLPFMFRRKKKAA